jgi:hypothetical protein
MVWAVVVGLGLWVGAARGQGCSQCRESVGQTPERTRLAYRRGIEVLVGAVVCVAGATVVVVRKFR